MAQIIGALEVFYSGFSLFTGSGVSHFGMLSGQFTPTEVASVKATAGIMIIVASASLFSWIMVVERIPGIFSGFLLQFSDSPVLLLLIVNILMLIVGMILDSTTATILIIPIIAPPVVAAGVDPVHLGIVIIFNLMIGLMTPSMGLSLFLISDVAKVPMIEVLKEIVPYFITLLVVLILITFIPEISTYISSFLG